MRPPHAHAGAALGQAPAIVLVRPQLGENIGAVARAMLNFALSDLRLVDPRDGWPNPAARSTASGADLVLERARVFDSLESALADCGRVYATTARPRELLTPVMAPDAAARDVKERLARGESAAILFGGERSGLSNDDIVRADVIVSIPVNPAFASLNIAQAALVLAYEWAKADGREPFAGGLDFAPAAPRAAFDGLMRHLIDALDRAGYFHPPDKRPHMERNLRAAFQRAGLTDTEVRALRGAVRALERGRGRQGESDERDTDRRDD
jgi:tRNA/rRNA methyltransferase